MELLCYAMDEPAPDIVPGRPERDWMDKFTDRHPYRCLPLSIANTTGWEIQCPISFRAKWNGGPRAEDIRLEPLGNATQDQLTRFVMSHFTEGIITFHTGWMFRTSNMSGAFEANRVWSIVRSVSVQSRACNPPRSRRNLAGSNKRCAARPRCWIARSSEARRTGNN